MQSSTQSPGVFPQSTISAAILDANDFNAQDLEIGNYTTLEELKHQLSKSTLMDNCGAMHIVNDKSLLELLSIVEVDGWVEAGTTAFPITARGICVMKNALNRPRGVGTEDLVLKDVAYIKDFHVNIVSEARLIDANV